MDDVDDNDDDKGREEEESNKHDTNNNNKLRPASSSSSPVVVIDETWTTLETEVFALLKDDYREVYLYRDCGGRRRWDNNLRVPCTLVPTANLAEKYLQRYKHPPDLRGLGHLTLIDVLVAKGMLELHSVAGKTEVRPSRKVMAWIDSEIEEEWSRRLQEGEVRGEHALLTHGLDPKDVMTPGEIIPVQTLPEGADEGDVLEVIVSDVSDVDRIYVQLRAHCDEVEDFMDELDAFYGDKEMSAGLEIQPFIWRDLTISGEEREFENETVNPASTFTDLTVAAPYIINRGTYNEAWHRAEIIGILPDIIGYHPEMKEVDSGLHLGSAFVSYIDYGTIDIVDLSHCRLLKRRFAELPRQAVRTSLHGFAKYSDMLSWRRRCTTSFFRRVRKCNLKGGLISVINKLGRPLELTFIDTVTNHEQDGINLNDLILEDTLEYLEKEKEKKKGSSSSCSSTKIAAAAAPATAGANGENLEEAIGRGDLLRSRGDGSSDAYDDGPANAITEKEEMDFLRMLREKEELTKLWLDKHDEMFSSVKDEENEDELVMVGQDQDELDKIEDDLDQNWLDDD